MASDLFTKLNGLKISALNAVNFNQFEEALNIIHEIQNVNRQIDAHFKGEDNMQSSYLNQAVRAYREEAIEHIGGGNYEEALKCIELASHLDELIKDYFEESKIVANSMFPDSSVIQYAVYDENTKVLTIEFVSNQTYVYYDVPSHIWENFLNASSKGTYFNQVIRGQYSSNLVKA